jgi:hypothetical protein
MAVNASENERDWTTVNQLRQPRNSLSSIQDAENSFAEVIAEVEL